jgi:hypothetical protein
MLIILGGMGNFLPVMFCLILFAFQVNLAAKDLSKAPLVLDC